MAAALRLQYEAPLVDESCNEAVEHSQSQALLICRKQYDRNHDPTIGALYANELRRAGSLDAARALAMQQLATIAYPKAVQVLGRIENSAGDYVRARALLSFARVAHAAMGKLSDLATDDQQLSFGYIKENRYAESLGALDQCITETAEIWLPDIKVRAAYCYMTAALTLLEIGHFAGAKYELERAAAIVTTAREFADLTLKQGELQQHAGLGPERQRHPQLAAARFRAAIRYANESGAQTIALSGELNLIPELADLGEFEEAETHLQAAQQLDSSGEDADTLTRLQAKLAFRRGDLLKARLLATSAYAIDLEEQFRGCVLLAEIAFASGDYPEAILWARCGAANAESIRAKQSALEVRALTLSARRRPYELWFVALVRQGRLAEAVAVFDQWQGRSLLDAVGRARTGSFSSLHDVVLHADDLQNMFPKVSRAPIARTVTQAELLYDLQSVELVALVEANNTVWRIADRHGELAIDEVGSLESLRPAFDAFVRDPTETQNGDDLGIKLLGAGAFRTTDEALFLVLDGELGSLPMPALRANNHWLIEMRPLIRASRLTELECVPAMTASPHATVIADPFGDLRAAASEAREVAARFGAPALIGPLATRSALFAAHEGGILHIATHVDIRLGVGLVAVYGDTVSALEIASSSPGPGLAFLATCGSAVSDEGEIAPSIATAFLARGTPQVVATIQAVGDVDAAEITRAFYKPGAVEDPARALQRAQVQAITQQNRAWPFYTLFGHDTCKRNTP